jgi:hypothetical protein
MTTTTQLDAENKQVDLEEVENESSNDDVIENMSPKDATRIIKELRKENANKRGDYKKLKEELDKLTAAQQAEKEEKLKEDGKLQELLEEKQKEIIELKSLKETNEEYENTFKEQLDAALKKLSPEQIELIEDSNWTISKKLKWALKMSEKNMTLTASPGSERPGGDTIPKDINLDEYRGPKGRIKLAKLRPIDPKKYGMILDML